MLLLGDRSNPMLMSVVSLHPQRLSDIAIDNDYGILLLGPLEELR
jgi:hypothetical protein